MCFTRRDVVAGLSKKCMTIQNVKGACGVGPVDKVTSPRPPFTTFRATPSQPSGLHLHNLPGYTFTTFRVAPSQSSGLHLHNLPDRTPLRVAFILMHARQHILLDKNRALLSLNVHSRDIFAHNS